MGRCSKLSLQLQCWHLLGVSVCLVCSTFNATPCQWPWKAVEDNPKPQALLVASTGLLASDQPSPRHCGSLGSEPACWKISMSLPLCKSAFQTKRNNFLKQTIHSFTQVLKKKNLLSYFYQHLEAKNTTFSDRF